MSEEREKIIKKWEGLLDDLNGDLNGDFKENLYQLFENQQNYIVNGDENKTKPFTGDYILPIVQRVISQLPADCMNPYWGNIEIPIIKIKPQTFFSNLYRILFK